MVEPPGSNLRMFAAKLLDEYFKVLMSRVMRKPTFWFPTCSNTNQAVHLQKMARGLKCWI